MNENIIYQYLEGTLSRQAIKDIEDRIKIDAQFAEEVALVRDMKTFATRQQTEATAKDSIRTIGEQYKPKAAEIAPEKETPVPEKSASHRRFYLLPLAAAAIILLGIFIKQTMGVDQLNPQELYAGYSSIAPLSFTTRDAATDEDLLQAQDYFNAKNYAAALPYFKTIVDENPSFAKAIFYQGYAKIANGDHGGGRTDLESLINNSQFKETARFHLALSYLKTNDPELARPYLSEIPNRSNHYKDAQEILNQL